MKKRVLIAALTGALLLGLCACARPAADPTDPPGEPTPSQKPSAEPTEIPPEEPSAEPTEASSEAPSEEPSESEAPSHPPIMFPTADPQQSQEVDDTVLPPSGVGEGDQDLHQFMDTVFPSVTEYEFPSMVLMSDERLIHEYPGLGAIPVKQRLIYTAEMTGVACEFAFVEVENEDDADAVNAIFQERIESQIAGGADYLSTIEQWEKNAKIYVNGRYVILAVHEMSGYMMDDFDLILGLG